MSAYAPTHSSQSGSGFIDRLPPVISPVRWLRRRFLRRPGSTFALGLATVVGSVIVVNALALQTERHPAPMFTALADPVTTAPVPAAAPAVPEPPARPASLERRAEPASVPLPPVRTPRPAREAEAARAPAPAAAAPTLPKDQMAALIRTTMTPAPAAAVEVPRTEDAQRIATVQRALNKLGYGPLKVDGGYGAASRQAFEKFEADRRLAVRGEPMGRSLRELARASGLAIE